MITQPDSSTPPSSMDASSVSVLSYMRSKPQGKVRRRVQDLRIPASNYDLAASRPALDLSHNESVRLAADSLLSRGLKEYHEVLEADREVDFLSELEKIYILENGWDGSTADPGESDDDDKEFESLSDGSQSATQCPVMSTDSEPSVAGWDQNSQKGVKPLDSIVEESDIEVYFQSDSRGARMKDLVREFLRKATAAIAIVMDSFSDVELLCDLLEASRKRNVSVHLLLDHLNLNLFVSMWQDLRLDSKNFPKLSVRSVSGQTYCAKTGRKLTGQIAESFIIADWTEVLSGSFSFSWLSWQVHRSLAVLLKGTAGAPFHQEFNRLYSGSKPVPGFVTYITLPPAPQKENADNTQIEVNMPDLSDPELEHIIGNTQPLLRGGTAGALHSVSMGAQKYVEGAVATQHGAQTNLEPQEENKTQIWIQTNPLNQIPVSYVQSQLANLTVTNTAERTVRVQDSNPLHIPSAQEQLRTVRYQSHFRTKSSLEHHNVSKEGLAFQQRGGNTLGKPLGTAAGQNTRRRQWYCSLNFKQKVDFPFDQPAVLSPSTSQQKQAKTGFMFPSSHPRGLRSGLQDQPQRSHQPPTSETSSSMSGPTAAHFKPHFQSDSRLLSPHSGPTLLKPHTSQQVKSPQRLNWTPQSHAVTCRPLVRHGSFGAYGTGQQADWRPFPSSLKPSLGRSKSLTERHSAGFGGGGGGLNPNTTRT